MRKLFHISAAALGGIGTIFCLAAIAFGWYAAANTTNRIERAANRLDHGLSAVDAPLARVELKVTAVHAQLDGVRTAAVAIATENPTLPRVKEAIDQLVARLISGVEQAETLADSLRAQAAGIRAAAEFVEHFHVDEKVTHPLHVAADKIDHAADALDGLREPVEGLKVAKAIDVTNKVLSIAGKALAGTDALANGVSSAREGLLHAREQTVEVQEQAGFWIYLAAAANTILWLWGGLGQLALIAWGRRTRPAAD
jgi:predicted nuclease with TOPRIM domain